MSDQDEPQSGSWLGYLLAFVITVAMVASVDFFAPETFTYLSQKVSVTDLLGAMLGRTKAARRVEHGKEYMLEGSRVERQHEPHAAETRPGPKRKRDQEDEQQAQEGDGVELPDIPSNNSNSCWERQRQDRKVQCPPAPVYAPFYPPAPGSSSERKHRK